MDEALPTDFPEAIDAHLTEAALEGAVVRLRHAGGSFGGRFGVHPSLGPLVFVLSRDQLARVPSLVPGDPVRAEYEIEGEDYRFDTLVLRIDGPNRLTLARPARIERPEARLLPRVLVDPEWGWRFRFEEGPAEAEIVELSAASARLRYPPGLVTLEPGEDRAGFILAPRREPLPVNLAVHEVGRGPGLVVARGNLWTPDTRTRLRLVQLNREARSGAAPSR